MSLAQLTSVCTCGQEVLGSTLHHFFIVKGGKEKDVKKV